MNTLDQARAVAQRLRKNGEGCTCMAYGPTECACGAEWGHDYTDQGAVTIDALVAEVERLTKINSDLCRVHNERLIDTAVLESKLSDAEIQIHASMSTCNHFHKLLGEKDATLVTLLDVTEELLDAVPPLWQCAERARDVIEVIKGEQT